MNWASSEVVAVLAFLLPGFVAAAVFYSLTCWPRPGAFERIVSALIFTAIAQAVTEGLLSFVEAEGNTKAVEEWKPLASVLVAVVLGTGLAFVSNADILHKLLRRARITRETSHPSEWYSTFAQLGDRSYVVLHLQGERRLYGYAVEWPGNPKEGHFQIADPEWLDKNNERVPAEGVSRILIPAVQVDMVEFRPVQDEQGG